MIRDVNKEPKRDFIDFYIGNRLFVFMTTLVNADALRVARTLTGLNQREVESESRVAQKSIVAAESEQKTSSVQTNMRLCDFYESKGIEFIGTPVLRETTLIGSGARWRLPPTLPVEPEIGAAFHTESNGTSFIAARSLLGLQQKEVADLAGIALRKVAALEAGGDYSVEAYRILRSYYEAEGVEFLGWGDVSTQRFYGVGVRWRASAKILSKGPAASRLTD